MVWALFWALTVTPPDYCGCVASSLSDQVQEVLTERVEDLASFSAERRGRELFAQSELLRVASLRYLARTDSECVPLAIGYVNTARYVAHTGQISADEARQLTLVAKLIASHELSAKALVDGRISLAQARLLAGSANKFPDQYTAAEAELVEAAASQDLDAFTRTIARWRHTADLQAAAEDTQHRHNSRGVWAQQRLDGSGTGHFDLDAHAFGTVMTALDAAAGKPDPRQALVQRTLPQRRADALVEMAMTYGPQDNHDQDDDTEMPTVHGRHRSVTMEAVINLNFDGKEPPVTRMVADMHCSGPVPWPIIEQLSCDANWRRVLSGPSQTLDYSSPTADITPNQRRAIRLRDHHCQFHGCDRTWQWCDVHHIISRHNGGPTTLYNLVLMCRHHHTLLHQGGWTFTRNPHTGQFQTCSP